MFLRLVIYNQEEKRWDRIIEQIGKKKRSIIVVVAFYIVWTQTAGVMYTRNEFRYLIRRCEIEICNYFVFVYQRLSFIRQSAMLNIDTFSLRSNSSDMRVENEIKTQKKTSTQIYFKWYSREERELSRMTSYPTLIFFVVLMNWWMPGIIVQMKRFSVIVS